MKVLVTGSNGLLGQALSTLLTEKSVSFIATGKGENKYLKSEINYKSLDISDRSSVERIVQQETPNVIINTAGITHVDHCEDILNKASFEINYKSVEQLVEICKDYSIKLVHISSCFVFPGNVSSDYRYTEKDIPKPIGAYATHKYMAEQSILKSSIDFCILRTSLVYGVGNALKASNMLIWAYHALKSEEALSLVTDQVRTPTCSLDLAQGAYLAATKEAKGIFNIVGPDTMNIYEYVTRIAQFFKFPLDRVSQTDSKVFKQKAPRPMCTPLSIEKAKDQLGYQPHTLEEQLSRLAPLLK